MFRFGDQLYRMTSRDEETLLIEPFYRQIFITVPLGGTARGEITVPPDRALYVGHVFAFLDPQAGVGAHWHAWQLNGASSPIGAPLVEPVQIVTINAGLATQRLLSDRQNGVTGDGAIIAHDVTVDFVFPPGIQRLVFDAFRTAGTGPAVARCWVRGYLIPPGRIGRSTN
jgi:hypothetical protein